MQSSGYGQPSLGNPTLSQQLAHGANCVGNHDGTVDTSECVFQAEKHIRMGSATARSMPMDDVERKRERLRRFMQESGKKAGPWAKQSGVSANSIYNFLNGHSEALDPLTYAKLARTAGVPTWRLNGELPEPASPTMLWVTGFVEAGTWQEAEEWDRSRWYGVDVPTPPRFHSKAKALEVRGDSMNLEYPAGSVVVWVEMLDFRPPRNGDHVIVYVHSHDDGIEATVKEYRLSDGKQWLWPRSSAPEHQAPVNVDSPGEHIKWIEIKGIVVGSYRPRVY